MNACRTIYRIWAVAFLLLVIICLSSCDNNESDYILDGINTDTITVKLYDGESFKCTDEQKEEIINFLKEAKMTRQKSTQDTPDITPVGEIGINDGDIILYYYMEGDEAYIEKPYSGIYKSKEDMNEFLISLFCHEKTTSPAGGLNVDPTGPMILFRLKTVW